MANHIELEGFITDVLPVEYYDELDRKKRRQHMILNIPQWTDSMGDLRGRIEDWKIVVLNKFIDMNNVSTRLIGKRVKIRCIISSRRMERDNDPMIIYPVSVRLVNLQVIQPYSNNELDFDKRNT